MRFFLALLLAAATVAAVPLTPENGDLIPTPAGPMHKSCVHQLPSGSTVHRTEDGMVVTMASGEQSRIERCQSRLGASSNSSVLPPGYDGWESYTAVQNARGFDAFLGTFSVPDMPKREPQILYIFTGLQNIDWIPKVDPEPSTPFDIIQPVLQYPGDRGDYWSVKSWYVTLDYGTMASEEVRVEPGDKIFGNMTRIGTDAWYVGSTVVSSGETTSITPKNTRLTSQPWAYNTVECYGCRNCDTYPVQDSIFTDLKLIATGGAEFAPTWLINPKPSQDRKCNEGATVKDGVVSFYFNGPK